MELARFESVQGEGKMMPIERMSIYELDEVCSECSMSGKSAKTEYEQKACVECHEYRRFGLRHRGVQGKEEAKMK